MDFNEFIQQAWSDHQSDAPAVAGRLNRAADLIHDNSQIPALTHLATHVYGEHLGRWEDAIRFLRRLKDIPAFVPGSESDHAIARSVAALEIARGGEHTAPGLSLSDRIRVLAVAASALCGQGQTQRAQEVFQEAIDLTGGLARSDPANRALAVTGNNLACSLEEKEHRSTRDNEMMILAAHTGRQFWEIAGGWLETERAEYRLAMSYLKAEDFPKALHHARLCLEIADKNGAEPLEFFFGNEALALAEKALGNGGGYARAVDEARAAFAKLGDDDKAWCEATLKVLQ
jgi:tetratricopeptide (TPR) repeat protein